MTQPFLTHCRLCKTPLGAPFYQKPAPSLTSMMSTLNVPTQIFCCPSCTHVQSPDLPDIQAFYDKDYKISLQSEGFDQLYAIVEDKPLYRTDHQANLIHHHMHLKKGAKILDYGCARADTLKKLTQMRPDLVPHVFDVSSDYKSAWQGWVETAHQAVYETPSHWEGTFDAISAHFVLEHVADPMAMLAHCATLLKKGGQLFISVPAALENKGDYLVVDHLNHFTALSLIYAFEHHGLLIKTLHQSLFNGAYIIIAEKSAHKETVLKDNFDKRQILNQITTQTSFWEKASNRLNEAAQHYENTQGLAIYGAGFYGTWIANQLQNKISFEGFIDQNKHLQQAGHKGLKVFAPHDFPSNIQTIFVGLNPDQAPQIIAQIEAFQTRDINFIYLTD